MGMYTEFVLGVNLKHDTPIKVIDILKYMIESGFGDPVPSTPVHPLFKTERWSYMLQCDSAYFGGVSDSVLAAPEYSYDNWHLSIRSNIKNYDSEIELFLNWLAPFVSTNGFIGYMRYEECEDPYLIYKETYDDNVCLYRPKELDNVAMLDDKWLACHGV